MKNDIYAFNLSPLDCVLVTPSGSPLFEQPWLQIVMNTTSRQIVGRPILVLWSKLPDSKGMPRAQHLDLFPKS